MEDRLIQYINYLRRIRREEIRNGRRIVVKILELQIETAENFEEFGDTKKELEK
jgi:hypothetical protein